MGYQPDPKDNEEPAIHPALAAGQRSARHKRSTVHWIGYSLTLLWIFFVFMVTGGRQDHPMFNLMFAVPLAGWILIPALYYLGKLAWRFFSQATGLASAPPAEPTEASSGSDDPRP